MQLELASGQGGDPGGPAWSPPLRVALVDGVVMRPPDRLASNPSINNQSNRIELLASCMMVRGGCYPVVDVTETKKKWAQMR